MKTFNKVSENEKNKILEMYNGKNPKVNQLSEQKIFSGVKSGIRGLGRRIKIKLKNMVHGFKDEKGKIKSSNLERDVAKMQSRASDLISTMIPFIESINQIKTKIETYPEVYGKEYVNDAKQVVNEIKELEDYMGRMRRVLEEFKEEGDVLEPISNTQNASSNQNLEIEY